MHLMSIFSQRHSTDPSHMSATLRGELDWIVMKALEKDRSRRYESASAFANDVQRYLDDEPVLACPPSTMYRFQKFARKHRTAFAASVAIAASLILGTTVSVGQAVRATTAEAQANENEQKANIQRDEAQKQRDEVRAAKEKLERTLYTAHVNLARHAWGEGDAGQVLDLLEQHRPKPGESDLRNFEWYYLYRLCNSELLTLKGHAQAVRSVTYSRVGKRLASGSDDKTVRIWDSESGREIRCLKGHGFGVKSVAFSPDGTRVASGGGGYDEQRKMLPGEVKLWDSETGGELKSFAGHAYAVRSVAFDPTGKRLASVGGDYSKDPEAAEVKVWDVATGQVMLDLKGHQGAVDSVVFSPDGKRLATADWNGQMKLWDAQTGQQLFSGGGYGKLSFSPDGTRLATAGSIRYAQSGKAIESFSRRNSRVNSNGMLYSPDGKRLADMAQHQPVRILDAESGEEIFSLKLRTAISEVAFSADGTQLAMANNDGTVTIANALHSPDDRTIGDHDSAVYHVAYSADGRRLVSGSHDKTIKVWDVKTGANLLTIHEDRQAGNVAISPDGKRLATGSKVWDANTGEILFKLQDEGYGAAFSPDGKRLAAGGKVWDAQTGQELFTLGDGRIPKAFSADGTLLVAGGMGPITVFNALTGKELNQIASATNRGPNSAVVFSPDGKRFASGSFDSGMVKVWDAKTGEEQLTLKGFSGGVMGVAFSSDGKRIAAQSIYRMLKVYDAETGDEMLSLKSGFGHGVTFSADGHQLAASGDRAVKIYDATPLPENKP